MLFRSDQNGSTEIVQVDYCQDFEAGICADCTQDSHCPGAKTCKGYKCVVECGDEDAIEQTVGDCSCCTDDGQCKELFESWSESRNTGEGKNEKSQTRPCVCTEDGPDCAPYLDTESCYKWVPCQAFGNKAKGCGRGFAEAATRAI